MTPGTPASYFQQTTAAFLAFQAGKAKSIPAVPTEPELKAVYESAKIYVAEEFVNKMNEAVRQGKDELRWGRKDDANIMDAYYAYFRGNENTTQSKLDTNHNGKLEYGRINGDRYLVVGSEVAEYTKAIAGAKAVERVTQQYSAGKKAGVEDAVINVAEAKAELIKQHGSQAYTEGGFAHVYGKVSQHLGSTQIETPQERKAREAKTTVRYEDGGELEVRNVVVACPYPTHHSKHPDIQKAVQQAIATFVKADVTHQLANGEDVSALPPKPANKGAAKGHGH